MARWLAMKTAKRLMDVKRVGLCVVLIAGMSQTLVARERYPQNANGQIFASSLATGGRLVIRRSPALGHNVSMSIYIDGRPAGTLVRARTFDRYITPGSHLLTVSPNSVLGRWKALLNIRPGETYTYTASVNVDRLVLTPARMVR
jgi:hypothetical protein